MRHWRHLPLRRPVPGGLAAARGAMPRAAEHESTAERRRHRRRRSAAGGPAAAGGAGGVRAEPPPGRPCTRRPATHPTGIHTLAGLVRYQPR